MSTEVAKMYGLCRRQREVFADRYEAGAVQKELSDAELCSEISQNDEGQEDE